jgi:hypothetical protein
MNQSVQPLNPINTALINVTVAAVMKAAKGLVRDFGEVDNLQISRIYRTEKGAT